MVWLSLINKPLLGVRGLSPAIRVLKIIFLKLYIKKGFMLCFARFGSNPNDGLLVGAFALNVNNASSNSNWNYGVALTY
jgi:hypothetical protein